MKRNVVLILLFLLTLNVFAQEEKDTAEKTFSLSIGPEWNMNARENFAAGAVMGFSYDFFNSFAAGAVFSASSNFKGIAVLEPEAMFRWYFWRPAGSHTGFFVQADIGAYLVIEEGEVIALFDGGIRSGFRFPLGETFFVEPYGRIGYPFVFGFGAIAGLRF